jgi:hypothetical protein
VWTARLRSNGPLYSYPEEEGSKFLEINRCDFQNNVVREYKSLVKVNITIKTQNLYPPIAVKRSKINFQDS